MYTIRLREKFFTSTTRLSCCTEIHLIRITVLINCKNIRAPKNMRFFVINLRFIIYIGRVDYRSI